MFVQKAFTNGWEEPRGLSRAGGGGVVLDEWTNTMCLNLSGLLATPEIN